MIAYHKVLRKGLKWSQKFISELLLGISIDHMWTIGKQTNVTLTFNIVTPQVSKYLQGNSKILVLVFKIVFDMIRFNFLSISVIYNKQSYVNDS